MTFIDLFAGVGGFRRGMELAGHKCIGFCEYDKFAVGSYTAMHLMTDDERENIKNLPMNKRLSEVLKEGYRHNEWYSNDIRRLRPDDIPRADVWCFGFPCQDISVAGKQKGLAGNRSGLFHTVVKLLEDTEEENRPSVLFIENVKNLLSINRGFDFLTVLVELDKIGYDAEWQVINSADYVPQNRERVFIIGHLRGRSGRKVFPIEAADRKNSVSIVGHREGYRRNSQTYSPNGITETLDTAAGGGRGFNVAQPVFCDMSYGNGINVSETASCLQARYNTNRKGECTGVAIPVNAPERGYKKQNGRRCKENGEDMFTLTGQDRHGIMIKVKNATKKGYSEASYGDSINLSLPNSKTRRGRVGKKIANTLDTFCNQGVVVSGIWSEKYNCYMAIRKLTPKECFRLQGWTDEYFERAAVVNSDSQLYKQAGNGVTVPVIYAIARRF